MTKFSLLDDDAIAALEAHLDGATTPPAPLEPVFEDWDFGVAAPPQVEGDGVTTRRGLRTGARSLRDGRVGKPVEVNIVEGLDLVVPMTSRQTSVPTPTTFFMEAGRDRRNMAPTARHMIDRYRGPSTCEWLPDFTFSSNGKGNPYHRYFNEPSGSLNLRIAYTTFDVLVFLCEPSQRDPGVAVTETEIVAKVIKDIDMKSTAENVAVIQDALRDMALFGIVARLKVGSEMAYALAEW